MGFLRVSFHPNSYVSAIPGCSGGLTRALNVSKTGRVAWFEILNAKGFDFQAWARTAGGINSSIAGIAMRKRYLCTESCFWQVKINATNKCKYTFVLEGFSCDLQNLCVCSY